jgi:hypothetical protein
MRQVHFLMAIAVARPDDAYGAVLLDDLQARRAGRGHLLHLRRDGLLDVGERQRCGLDDGDLDAEHIDFIADTGDRLRVALVVPQLRDDACINPPFTVAHRAMTEVLQPVQDGLQLTLGGSEGRLSRGALALHCGQGSLGRTEVGEQPLAIRGVTLIGHLHSMGRVHHLMLGHRHVLSERGEQGTGVRDGGSKRGQLGAGAGW